MGLSKDFPLRHVGDQKERLLRRVPSWLRNKPGVYAFMSAAGDMLQSLEDAVFGDVYGGGFWRATGVRLDAWGALYGLRRDGLKDEWFRKLIWGRALAGRCDGHEDRMVNLWKALTGPSAVEFRLAEPKCIVLTAWRDDYMPTAYAKRAAKIVRGVAPTGAVVLLEARTQYLGFEDRTRTPRPEVLGRGIPCRTH